MESNVKAFLYAINTNEALREKISQAAKTYTGENTDEAIWADVIKPIADEAGYDVSLEALKAFVDEQTEPQEVSEDELLDVAGGFTFCIIIGGGNGIETGNGNTSPYEREGLGACAYVGIGFSAWGKSI